jgi:hypothetical protein
MGEYLNFFVRRTYSFPGLSWLGVVRGEDLMKKRILSVYAAGKTF